MAEADRGRLFSITFDKIHLNGSTLSSSKLSSKYLLTATCLAATYPGVLHFACKIQDYFDPNKIKNENKYFGRDEYANSVIVESNNENLNGKIKSIKILTTIHRPVDDLFIDISKLQNSGFHVYLRAYLCLSACTH